MAEESTTFRVCGDVEIPDYTLKVDPKTRGIADVFVLIRRRPERIHPDLLAAQQWAAQAPPLTVEIKGCQFSPYAMIVPPERELQIKSSDPFAHNIHLRTILNPGWGGGMLWPSLSDQEESVIQVPRSVFSKAEIIPCELGSDIYPHMEGWWYISDHPYHAITCVTGEFQIDKLPVGQHVLTIWHSRTGYIAKSLVVDVQPGQTLTLPPVHVPVSRFLKK